MTPLFWLRPGWYGWLGWVCIQQGIPLPMAYVPFLPGNQGYPLLLYLLMSYPKDDLPDCAACNQGMHGQWVGIWPSEHGISMPQQHRWLQNNTVFSSGGAVLSVPHAPQHQHATASPASLGKASVVLDPKNGTLCCHPRCLQQDLKARSNGSMCSRTLSDRDNLMAAGIAAAPFLPSV